MRLGLVGVVVVVCTAVLASVGLAVVSPVCTTAAGTTSCVFSSTGSEQSLAIPVWVDSVQVVARGAAGGTASFSPASPGGKAAVVGGNVAVTPGASLYVEVGGLPTFGTDSTSAQACWFGFVPCVGGFNGGGSSVFGGGGGGASDVRTTSSSAANTLASRLIVAAGGGGSGTNSFACGPNGGGRGGDAGASGASGLQCGGLSATAGIGGGAGTSSGGSGGAPNGANGVIGVGGDGGTGFGAAFPDADGGGGGGGLFGGGGGGGEDDTHFGCCGQSGAAGGGGGGSNLVPPGGTSGLTTDPPQITISYLAMPTTDSCKKGGWQAYGVFKNQGDCVSFVATGGKNPPTG
jgi:hypothetical protein